MVENKDLWPKDLVELPTEGAPVRILRAQASKLGPRTGDRILAKVETLKSHSNGGEFLHEFNLIVPDLDDYKYTLFTVRQGVSPYPVSVDFSGMRRRPGPRRPSSRGENEATDQKEFLKMLGDILGSEKTKEVIQTLLAQTEPASASLG